MRCLRAFLALCVLQALLAQGSVAWAGPDVASGARSAVAPCAPAPLGLAALSRVADLPLARDGARAYGVSSHDPTGGNVDHDRFLYYQDPEFVLFDVTGPGCIYNIWFSSLTMSRVRFYFDGETTPRVDIRAVDMFSGATAPFLSPLVYDALESSGGFTSFLPMPFAKSCKVTTLGATRYYNIAYHTYASAEGVQTFTGAEDTSAVRDLWARVGADPKQGWSNETISGLVAIAPGNRATLADLQGAGAIASLKLRLDPSQEAVLQGARLRFFWDGDPQPSVDVPLGLFFGSGLGPATVRGLLIGMDPQGNVYCYFPMPFWRSARLEVENRSGTAISALQYEIQYTRTPYPAGQAGYFHAQYRESTQGADGRDCILLDTAGRGHFVGATVDMSGGAPYDPIYLEGDPRVHVDGSLSPAIYGTGTEDYFLGGWYFLGGLFSLPTHGLVAQRHTGTARLSCYRLHLGDVIPYAASLRFGLEHGPTNDVPIHYRSVAFYYQLGAPAAQLADELDVGNAASEAAHGYAVSGGSSLVSKAAYYEGDDDDILIADEGRLLGGRSEFRLALDPANQGALLRRRCDRSVPGQHAAVYVDGAYVGRWRRAGSQTDKQWSDEDFEIPAAFTAGKSSVAVTIVKLSTLWTEFRYWAYSMGVPALAVAPSAGWSEPGRLLSFAAVYRAPGGQAGLRYADLLLNTTPSPTNGVTLRYDVQADRLYIRRPDDGAWLGGGAPGSAGTAKTTYAALDYGRSGVVAGADAITVTWAFTPTYRHSGKAHRLYLSAEELSGASIGWVDCGDWTINRAPTHVPPTMNVNATVGAGVRLTLDPRYGDLDGWANLDALYLAIADAPPTGEMGPNAVYLKYDQGENKVYLADTAGTAWLGGVTPRSGAVLENAAVQVFVQWSYPGAADARVRITYWRLAFKPGFVGAHRVYLRAVDRFPGAQGDTGWRCKAALTVGP